MKRLLSILVTLTLTWTVSLAGPTKGSNIDSYYMQLGMDALRNGNVDEAIQSFEKVHSVDKKLSSFEYIVLNGYKVAHM